MYAGGWLNGEDGMLYLDASQNFKSMDDAIQSAISTHQIAIFDLNTFNEIRIAEYLIANPGNFASAESREWYRLNPRPAKK